MAEIIDARGRYSLDFLMIPREHIGKFNEFMEEFGDVSDYDLYKQILDTKSKVSANVLNQHMKNLDALSSMTGFVTDSTKGRIELVKRVLNTDTGSSKPKSHVENQFWGGSSLLLWFLILAAIWRRPFFGGPGFGGGFLGRGPFF
ncbi:hypothetical protein [Alkaliphilus serpentinus]|uniref:Uncharacterized protein n=1 Tax=Alkaliphilus serpentinus TaxID=1482731 RepID=A0A833HP93_9FIRM|nr:hypothetical protein [Alkaliphilus serpentinus]KAB3530506.1 hypothetical protein F8153_06545 [Alkaliphilus serpentinus]